MEHRKIFAVIRKVLETLGLSPEAVDDILDRINDFLFEKGEQPDREPAYPYVLHKDFLSPAEHSFFSVLKSIIQDQAIISIKTGLGDLFYAKSKDPSELRIYRNKIDRKHADLLLCDPKIIYPLVGIELDDKSHEVSNPQARDEFVAHVFQAAKSPLVCIPVKPSYSVSEFRQQPQTYLQLPEPVQQLVWEGKPEVPHCPKCGTEMILRSAKSSMIPTKVASFGHVHDLHYRK